MPVSFEILEDGWVACYTFEKPWTTAEFTAHYPEDAAYRLSVNHPVHWFLNAHTANQLPPADILRARINAPAMLYPTSGKMVLAGTTPLETRIAETILRLIRYKNARFFGTPEEAWRYLRQQIIEDKRRLATPGALYSATLR